MKFLTISRTMTHDYSIRCSFWYPITSTQNGTFSPLLPKKPQQNNKSSVVHIFSHVYLLKVKKNQTPKLSVLNSRTVGTEVPNGRLYQLPKRRGPELSGYPIQKSNSPPHVEQTKLASVVCWAKLCWICRDLDVGRGQHPSIEKEETIHTNPSSYPPITPLETDWNLTGGSF